MKFDFAIGNPPYQDNAIGENDTYAPPVYNKFLDAAYAVADSVEMIHPARFLFNAGSTPKAWNEKMLNDPHFKVMHYEEDASKVFANTDIKGGVAITYRTSDAKYEPIVVFTKYPALNHILHKVNNTIDFVPMDTLVVTRTAYRLTEKLHQEHTEAMDQLSKGHPYDMSTNIFNRLPQFFFNEAPNDGNKYIRILGRENSQRVYKYIRSDYVNQPKNLFQYKIFLPSANGNGVFGETLTAPVLGIPGIGSTETFISVGCFDSKKKRDWDVSAEEENPYSTLPQLNLYTYQMSEIIKDELQQGIEIDGETEEYAFDLNEFFAVTNGKFNHESSVDKFLDALTRQTKFPFSTEKLRDELKHTFWLLDRVDSAKVLAKKLREHPIFQEYEVVLAAGDGKLDDDEETMKSYDKVVAAIAQHEKTITLSVGQLTTGITIPEWTAVLMLSNMRSPALYMQAAFRAQNPCLFKVGTSFKRKENAYVFDFDPARTLTIFEQFANNLNPNTAKSGGTAEERKENVKELLNFFPVIGEDEQGELVELDAEKVLTIPRKIRSIEVVKRGFMSNFLFQNISNIFGAPKEVIDIITKFEPIEEPKSKVNLTEEVQKDLSLDENWEVALSDEFVIGRTQDVFGDKIYDVTSQVQETMTQMKQAPDKAQKAIDKLKEAVKQSAVKAVVDTAQSTYGSDMKAADKRQIESKLNHEADRMIDKLHTNYEIERNVIENQRVAEQQARYETGKTSEQIDKEFEQKQKVAMEKFNEELTTAISDFAKESTKETVKTIETKKKEREKETIEDGVRDHLRGFSRTIPSFLMAYGDNTVTLATFDTIIPDKVFLEVTSITLDQFKFLRDGGDYVEEETGQTKHFDGQLFDSVVFDDSVKEFLALKKKLADYFDEKSVEDIFDYIPPQKTNQIFTPKTMVKKMVDMLEQENPGCFDMPDKTFIDLYMKSGLYITEIVKRLYQSDEMKKQFPDNKERLKHIFEKQVYGLAPTEIIYKIATSYILGFDEDTKNIKHNFRQLDALPYAKEGTLDQVLDELYSKEE